MEFHNFDILIELASSGGRAKVDPEIFAEVYRAWYEMRTLKIHYYRVEDGAAMDLFAEPHLLKMRDGVWYIKTRLVSSSPEAVIRTLALHRITEAYSTSRYFKRSDSIINAVSKDDISLFALPILNEVRLILRNSAIQYALEYLPPGEFRMQRGEMHLTIQDIEEYRIRNFILLSGGNATVAYPESLRKHIIEETENIIAANSPKTAPLKAIKKLKEMIFGKLF